KIWDFTNDSPLTYARSNKKVGFINGKGEWVIQPAYDKVRAFNVGLAPVNEGKEWGFINEKGEKIIDIKYRDAEIFSDNGLAPVKEKKLWGFVDKTGKLVIPMEYDISIGMFGFLQSGSDKGFIDGLARVKKNKEWGFIDKTGKVVGKWHQNAEAFVDTSK
ncbi:MAG: WG repeat-containing protein, partial [Aequorivita sp.]|nr:WG repeat-containing protein [Aequorivita sp.]